MTKTTRIVCLCILGAVGTLCGVSIINTPTHVQLVYYINEDIWGIAQGNSNFLNKVPGARRLLNASDSNSRFYIGTNIQFAEYHTSKDEYKRKNKEPIKRFSKKKY
jgi:hypothetical protein